MRMETNYIRELESRASRTWPAEENVPVNGWLLRASGGVTRRANSVLTAGDGPVGAAGWLEEIEGYYRERSLTPAFQVTEGSPSGLDDILGRHGYEKEAPCVLMTARADEVTECARHAAIGATSAGGRQQEVNRLDAGERNHEAELRVESRADETWLRDFVRLEQFPESRLPFYRGLCGRMPPGTCFFSLLQGESAIAVATLVGEDGWGGIINVAVDSQLRGQGLGKRLMGGLAAYAKAQQIDRLYLQVMANNEPAFRMYAKLGFAPAYEYHYRIKI